jgi:hypothetical protein
MEESPSKYYEVIERNGSVDLWSEGGSDVKKVKNKTIALTLS